MSALRSVGAVLAGLLAIVVLSIGVVGFAVSLAGAVGTWDKGPDFGPHWYPLALVVVAIPSAWIGGKLVGERSGA